MLSVRRQAAADAGAVSATISGPRLLFLLLGPILRLHLGFQIAGVVLAPGALLPGTAAPAQTLSPDTISARSISGQFIVRATGTAEIPAGLARLATNQNFVFLEPRLVPTSCERIKQCLARELGASAPWRGKIFLAVRPARSADDPVTIFSERFKNGWRYQVELPNPLERTRYVRAIAGVLLQEMANRSAANRPAEVPTWLIEGFTRQLLASSELEIILPPAQKRASGLDFTFSHVDARRQDPLETAHKVLLAGPALTFQELSWPTPDQLTGTAGEVYGCSAQVFVDGLARLPDGRACLRTMIDQLARFYNWQFAFLRAFQPHFQRLIEVEKWWALALARFTGRDLAQTWAAVESWQQLDKVIRFAVQVRAGTNELPMRAEVSLQAIIREWGRDAQTLALQEKLRELFLLRLRVATNHIALVDDYRQVLQTYLENRDHKGLIPFRKEATRRHAVAEALQQLDILDTRRMALAPAESRNQVQTATKAEPR